MSWMNSRLFHPLSPCVYHPLEEAICRRGKECRVVNFLRYAIDPGFVFARLLGKIPPSRHKVAFQKPRFLNPCKIWSILMSFWGSISWFCPCFWHLLVCVFFCFVLFCFVFFLWHCLSSRSAIDLTTGKKSIYDLCRKSGGGSFSSGCLVSFFFASVLWFRILVGGFVSQVWQRWRCFWSSVGMIPS